MAIYYIKSNGGTGSGLSDDDAWTFEKLKATTLAAGDTILFKRGHIFYGAFSTYSGVVGSPTTYGAYGTGENPIITGLTELTSWTLESGNIYYATLDVPRLNMVLLDDVVQGMGRYPNIGYLQYTGSTGNTSISGTTVGAIPFDPIGGEVVIRKYRWILDRHPITSRSSNVLNYSAANEYGNNSNYNPVNNNGYFIQNHLSTVTEEGEWYYDTTLNRLYMHFGAGNPTGRIVRIASIDKNIVSNSKNYVNFSNLTLEGANLVGLEIGYTGNINVTNCKIINQGGDAIYGIQGSGFVAIDNIIVDKALNNGILGEFECGNWTVNNCTVTNISQIAGMGKSGDGAGNGISVNGNTIVIDYNTVTNSGYNGIATSSSDSVEINNNIVDTFCTIKDDGAGIYEYDSVNVNIDSNKVYNAVGAYAGSEAYFWEAYGKAAGIYIDGFLSANVVITNNYVENGEWGGLFINSSPFIVEAYGNTFRDFAKGIHVYIATGQTVDELNIHNNRILKSREYALYIENRVSYDVGSIGVFDVNVYNINSGTEAIYVSNTFSGGVSRPMTLKQWQSDFGLDLNSFSNPKIMIKSN